MTGQTIEPKRISEDPRNFTAVFDLAMATARQVADHSLDPAEATAVARNLTIGERALGTDLKGRLIDQRLRPKLVDQPAAIEGTADTEAG